VAKWAARPQSGCLWRSIGSAPWAFGFAGTIYAATALVLGAILVVLAVRLRRSSEADRRDASRLFVFSIFYLSVLFAALLADHSGDRRSSTSPAQTVSTRVQADEV
jgi:heme O synthase-like polyprenyltransferase